jgi:hypothetical protein
MRQKWECDVGHSTSYPSVVEFADALASHAFAVRSHQRNLDMLLLCASWDMLAYTWVLFTPVRRFIRHFSVISTCQKVEGPQMCRVGIPAQSGAADSSNQAIIGALTVPMALEFLHLTWVNGGCRWGCCGRLSRQAEHDLPNQAESDLPTQAAFSAPLAPVAGNDFQTAALESNLSDDLLQISAVSNVALRPPVLGSSFVDIGHFLVVGQLLLRVITATAFHVWQ